MHELAHEFTHRKISPWGGIKYFHKTYVTSGTKAFLNTLDLPQPGSNRGYDPVELVEGFMTSVILGTRRLEHTGMIRTDKVIEEIFGWNKGIASARIFSRFFDKFDVELNDRIFPQLMKHILEQVPIRYMTLDIDSSVITRYGNQECAIKGYNPGKRGRPSHNPIMAYSDELKMVVNAWMRTGDSHSTTDAVEFLEETFSIVPRDNVGLIRGDAGFYIDQIMSYLESGDHPVKYMFRAKMTSALYARIIRIRKWHHKPSVMKHGSYAEIQYQGSKWKESRRLIIVLVPKRKANNGHKNFSKNMSNWRTMIIWHL